MAKTSSKGWVPQSLSCFVVRNREYPHKPQAPDLKPPGDVLESCWRSWSQESGWCEHSPGSLNSDTAPPLLASASSCQPRGFHDGMWYHCVFPWPESVLLLAKSRIPSSKHAEGREQSGGRKKAGNKSSGVPVERICLEELSQWRMFSWSSLRQMLPLVCLQLCCSPGHTFSCDVCIYFSAVASGAAWLG